MKLKSSCPILLLFSILIHPSASADFEPAQGLPSLTFTDGNYVDGLTANINYSVNDLHIGTGRHALSHSISIQSTNVLNYGFKNTGTPRFWGYKDKFIGGIYRKLHTEVQPNQSGLSFYVIYVFDDVSAYEFVVDENSNTFMNIKDPKVTLSINSDRRGYTLTRADGTQVIYTSKNNALIPSNLDKNFSPYGIMQRIEYTDNFIITIHRSDSSGIQSPIRSVTSNNGLQLKYIYQDDNRAIPSQLKTKLSDAGYSNPEAHALDLSQYMPKEIIALNNAVETCPLLNNSCNPQKTWPKTKYTWPIGAPYSMFVADSDFNVDDMQGVTTTFKHYPHYYLSGFHFPRIKEINTSQGLKINYEYLVRYEDEQAQYEAEKEMWTKGTNFYSWVDQSGKLVKSVGPAGTFKYDSEPTKVYPAWGPTDMSFNNNNNDGLGGITKVTRMYNRDDTFYPNHYVVNVSPTYIETWDKEVELENTLENKPILVTDKLTGIPTSYTYDQMGRVRTIDSDGLKKTFGYPYSYTGGCDIDRSYCHKPTSVTNNYIFTNQRTYTSYTYHAPSGNVASVRSPQNMSGISPIIKLEYEKYTPRYINSSGSMSNGSSAIWLRKKVTKCENSAFSGENCSGNDKITETYDYGTGDANNLFLIGKTVTGQRDGLTRKYCYTYDRFGNVIGKTEPKANVNCNTIRGF